MCMQRTRIGRVSKNTLRLLTRDDESDQEAFDSDRDAAEVDLREI